MRASCCLPKRFCYLIPQKNVLMLIDTMKFTLHFTYPYIQIYTYCIHLVTDYDGVTSACVEKLQCRMGHSCRPVATPYVNPLVLCSGWWRCDLSLALLLTCTPLYRLRVNFRSLPLQAVRTFRFTQNRLPVLSEISFSGVYIFFRILCTSADSRCYGFLHFVQFLL